MLHGLTSLTPLVFLTNETHCALDHPPHHGFTRTCFLKYHTHIRSVLIQPNFLLLRYSLERGASRRLLIIYLFSPLSWVDPIGPRLMGMYMTFLRIASPMGLGVLTIFCESRIQFSLCCELRSTISRSDFPRTHFLGFRLCGCAFLCCEPKSELDCTEMTDLHLTLKTAPVETLRELMQRDVSRLT